MPIVIAVITPHSQHRSEVLAALQDSVKSAHGEPGCQLYALHDAGEAFILIESWDSNDALDQHNSGAVVRVLVSAIAGKLKLPTQITRAIPLPTGDAPKGMIRGG